MKSKLSRKVAKVVGILVIVISLIFGIVFVQLAKSALLKQTDSAIQTQAVEDAKYISVDIDRNLSVLNEVASRARTVTMDFPTQQASLLPDIDRLGYESMLIVTPDGNGKDITTGQITNLSGRDYIKTALAGKTVMSDVLISKVTGKPVIMEAAPIKSGGKVVGVLVGIKRWQLPLGDGQRHRVRNQRIFLHPQRRRNDERACECRLCIEPG